MKNTDIQKIRQLLKDITDAVNRGESNPTKRQCLRNATEALTLLPCETCEAAHTTSCPDCQPKSCVCCEEITEENAHLHRNCGK